mgnify:CR=1 FL=1
MLTCKNCVKIFTKECPIRVWGRNEGNNSCGHIDVNPDEDFCSRMKEKLNISMMEKDVNGEWKITI